VLPIVAALCLVTSCEKDPGPDDTPEEFDRAALLTNLGNNLIVPAYQDFAQATATLNSAALAFSANVNQANLDALRAAWLDALTKWQYAAIYEFGPAETALFRDNSNVYPTDTVQINTNLAAGTWDFNVIANLDAKGLQAIDFMLYGTGTGDASILARFTTAPDAAVRLTYLVDLTAELNDLAQQVSNAWLPSGGNYLATFTSNSGTSAGSPISLLANAFNKYFEKYVRTGKISIPSGALTFSQTPEPTKIEALYKNDIAVSLTLTGMDAIARAYRGEGIAGDGIGFDDYLNHVDARFGSVSLDQAIENQIQVVNSATQAIPEPLSDQVVSNQTAVLDIHAKMTQLVALFKNDMMSAMGLIITYTDTDGD
jgi:hypothetical protein